MTGRLSLTLGLLLLPCYTAIPIRGNYPWSVILCKYYDMPFEPRTPTYFNQWLFDERNIGSIARYFRTVSNGLYTINGSSVHGWFTMPYRKQAMEYLASKDSNLNAIYPSPGAVPLKTFHKVKQLCVETARSEGVQLNPNVIAVINDDNVAMFCSQEGILLTPNTIATAALTHEMVHSFHIGHSYSDRNVQIFPYADFGEYDDIYDLMSTSNAYMHRTTYGMQGPGLNGPHLDYLGWLPMDRVVIFGKDGSKSETYNLASLSIPHAQSTGPLMIEIPYDRDNKLNVITVTFRTRDNLDAGAPSAAVLIHKLQEKRGHVFSYVVTNDKSWRHEWYAGDKFVVYLNRNRKMSIQIEILGIDGSARIAQVRVTSSFEPTECLDAEVKRKATEQDEVCVNFREVDRILHENRLAWTLTSLSGNCRDGFEKRLATENDHVCVTPERAKKVRAQNALFSFYRSFYDSPSWGLNTCESGYVWRSLDPYDYVCVPDYRRSNLDPTQVVQKSADGHCPRDFKSRSAFNNDGACVPRNDTTDYFGDNYDGQFRLKYRKFFNGIDNVE